MPNAFDPLDQTDDAVPVVTLDKDAPKELQDLFARIAPGSVAIAKQRDNNINIYYEGGIYTRKDKNREPTQEERNEYAVIAAGRAKENYPTIAKFTIHMDDVKHLTIVGVVQMMWKPWKVLWVTPAKVWGCPTCNPAGVHEYEDEYICRHNGGTMCVTL